MCTLTGRSKSTGKLEEHKREDYFFPPLDCSLIWKRKGSKIILVKQVQRSKHVSPNMGESNNKISSSAWKYQEEGKPKRTLNFKVYFKISEGI